MSIPRPLAAVLFAIPWGIAIIALAWLVVLRFPPSGVFQVETTLDGASPWIFPFLPGERVSKPGVQDGGWTGQRIIDDPVYMSTRVPGPYETVDVELEFRPVNQPLLELGLIHDAEGRDLELRPLFSSELESAAWQPITRGDRHGYIRAGTSPDRLLQNDTRGMAIWNATATMPLMSDPPGEPTVMNVSLRGSHDFYLVPTDVVSLTLALQPVNRRSGNDIVSFRVFRGDTEIAHEAFTISGSRDTRMGRVQEHTIRVPTAEPGVYRVAFAADDDVFIRRISTPSRRMVVGPRLVFGDVVGYATSTQAGVAWTTSRHLVAETFHTEGLQTIVLGGSSAELRKTHQSVRVDRVDTIEQPVELRAPQGDVRLVGDGFFAFSPEAFFEPKPRRLTSSTELNQEHIDVVATSYVRPTPIGDGWYQSTATFQVNPSLDRLRFVISATGVMSRSGAMDIRAVRVTYRRAARGFDDWLQIVKRELVNAWRRL